MVAVPGKKTPGKTDLDSPEWKCSWRLHEGELADKRFPEEVRTAICNELKRPGISGQTATGNIPQ